MTATALAPRVVSLSKARRGTLYVSLALLTVLFGIVGTAKLVGAPFMLDGMAAMHYGPLVTRLIGLVELIAVAGLWWPRTRTLVLTLLPLIFAGAAGSHLGSGQPPAEVLPKFAVFGAVLLAAYVADRGRDAVRFFLRPPAR